MWARTPSFRDLTCFAIFVVAWRGMVDSGYGQQASLPVRVAAAPLNVTPTVHASVTHNAPLVQTPDFRSVISVGRTLSSLTVGGVVNNTLTITYRVYNLRPERVDGVLLTTTLQAGVTYQSASPAPDRNGQQLAFSLGSLPALGTASATLTVTLANGTTQIDGGAAAFAYWNGLAVQAIGLAAALRNGTVDPNLLQSTINANLSDPFVTGQAAQLGNDPTRIYQFVRDQIGYESYAGALRGARGTLWSMAGNSLDKASLLVALLRASGIPARYVAGTLALAPSKQLILSMFPPQIQLTGYVAAGATLSDPANDSRLQAEAQQHYWVQFDAGNGFTDADPDFAGAQTGQTFAALQTTFADVPSNLNHTVTVKLNAEFYQQGLFGPITSNTTPLTHTFTSAELVGHPLTLGHFVQSNTAGFVISATTNTYSPYLMVGQNDLNLSDDPIFRGTDYQEVLTNFPFSSQILTGLFLQLDTADPSGNTTTNSHAILDRIGFAARQGLASATVSLPAGGGPAVTQFDNVSISVESSLTDHNLYATLSDRDTALQSQLQQLQAQANPNSTLPADQAVVQQTALAGQYRLISATQTMTGAFSLQSAELLAQAQAGAVVKAYYSSPRMILATSQVTMTAPSSTVKLALDLRKDDIRALAYPGQNLTATPAFHPTRGFAESAAESQVIASMRQSAPGSTLTASYAAADIIIAAKNQGIPVASVTAASVGVLNTLSFSADAKARITAAVQSGKVVLTPQSAPVVGGQQLLAWYEIDPATGVTVDTLEDGTHGGVVAFAAMVAIRAIVISFVIGLVLPPIAKFVCNKVSDNKTLCVATVVGGGALAAAIAGYFAKAFCYLAALKGNAVPIVADEVSTACQVLITGAGGAGLALGSALPVDPPLSGMWNGASIPPAFAPPNRRLLTLAKAQSLNSGAVQGQVQAASFRAAGQMGASWSSSVVSGFQIGTLAASNATVKNSSAQTVGTGTVALSLRSPISSAVAGAVNYSVTGAGDLSFYGPATSALGVSGNWGSYSATLTGSPTVTLTTDSLTLNGATLPSGTYTVTAASISAGGSGQTTSPNFAASASLSITSGAVYVGPGTGTFTSGGGTVSPASGISLDGFTGTASITGNGTMDSVTLNGNASKVLAVAGSPSPLSTNQNTPVTFATNIATSFADTYDLIAEAPAGWSLSLDASGKVTVTPAPGTQSGTFPIFIIAASEADGALVAQTAVNVTLAGTPPGVSLSVTPDPTFTLPLGSAQLPSAYRATIRNLGPVADTFAITFPTPPPGFTVLDSETSVTIPAGGIAIAGIYLSPAGVLPAPNTIVPFSVAATSTTNPAVTSNVALTFTVPAVQAISMAAAPASLSGTTGTPLSTVLTIQSVGNVAVTAALTSTLATGISLGGLSNSLSINPGQSATQNLTLTPGANAPLAQPLLNTITATFGSQTVSAPIQVQVNSAQAVSAFQGAAAAQNLGRTDIATTLSNLSTAITQVVGSCGPNTQAALLAYLDNLILEMNAPFLTSFATDLSNARAAIAAANCANIGAALTQLNNVLASLSTALNSPAAFPFSFELLPNNALANPNVSSVFLISLQNKSTTTATYTLNLGSLPNGVSGSLSQTSITLAPGAFVPVSNAPNNLSVTITPTAGMAFQFSVTASINGVAGSGQTAYGTLTARNTFLAVQDVKATPGFTNSGGSVDVVTHIANLVNANKQVQVTLAVKDSGNNTVANGTTQTVQLSVQSLLTTIDFGQISTQGFANGNYSLVVTVIDPLTNQPMPGGSGTGTLLVGSPVTATLTASPQTLAPVNGSVTSTLTVSATSGGGTGGAPFSLLGSVATTSPANSVAVNGNTVYTCDANEISVINATNPANPTVTGTAFAGAIANATNIYCDIQKGDLVMLADAASTLNGNNPSFLAFDIATNPASPSLIASTPVFKRFFGAPYYQGNTAFFATNVIFFSGGSIYDQAGDFVSLDVTNFSAPTVLGTTEQNTKGPTYGGSFNVYGITPVSTQLAYATSTTSQGAPNGTGTGQLWAINTSNPASMSVVAQVNVPGTINLWAPQVQGTTAVAIGGSGGWNNPCCNNGPFAGNIVVAVFDTSNPQSPQLVANVPTTFLPTGAVGRGSAVIGPHLFLYAGIQDASQNNFLMLVDTTDPHNPMITTYPVPRTINVMRPVGTLLYAPTDGGLDIYSIPGTGAIQYTAAVQIAKNATVAYNANSFSVPPTSTVTGAGFDTVSWTNPPSNTITWTSNVTGIQAGQVLPIDLGGTVNFTVPAGSGTVTLPQADVNSDQILGLNPSTQTVAPGIAAAYTLTVKNPTASQVTYNLAVTGVAPNWVTLQASVTVPASGQTIVPLTLRSEVAAAAGTLAFVVTATAGGASGSVQGTLILQGAGNIGTLTSTTALGVAVSLIPTAVTGGQATAARFVVQVTNVGNANDTYALSLTAPGNVTGIFSQTIVAAPPGLGNFRQVILALTAAQGTPPGPIAFSVKAVSQTNASVTGSAAGTLNVVGNGVKVSLSPLTSLPGGTLQMTVTNSGTATDTFDLAVGGEAAPAVTLATAVVTLAAGGSQNVGISIGPGSAFTLGNASLVAVATSRGNPQVSASAGAIVTVPGRKGVSAVFKPASQVLSAPGKAVFLLDVQNTGTVEDGYSATIISTVGPLQASLAGFDGKPSQSLSPFRLPGVGLGELVLNTTLTSLAPGSVTVKITSLTDPTVTATATATLGPAQTKPAGNPGKNQNVLKNTFTSLDGSDSSDPAGNHLTYRWTVTSAPKNAKFDQSALYGANSPRPFFNPDKEGQYVFQLVVNNGSSDSSPVFVTVTAYNNHVPPNADAGKPVNARRGATATVDGSLSRASEPSHPNKPGPVSFLWTLAQTPAGSRLVNGSIRNNTQAIANFTPDLAGLYVFNLTVSDGNGSASDQVTVTASDPNVTPNAVAGKDRRILPGLAVNLDGSLSNDPDSGPQALTYRWRFAFGALPDSAMGGASTPAAAFTPAATGFYVTRLDVSDGTASAFDQATIMVANACDANADGTVDSADIDLMNALVGQRATSNDPLDQDKDGVITDSDISLCQKASKGKATAPGLSTADEYLEQSAGLAAALLAPQRPAISDIRNAASLVLGAVAPGEAVVISGLGFGGPAQADRAIRSMPRTLAGTQVLFDGAPASLLYVTPDQIGAIVPHSVAGKPATSVLVETGLRKSDPLSLPVAAAAPGIFTVTGEVQAIAENEDGSMNSPSNPAAAGSVVTIFVNGVGRTEPPLLPARAFVGSLPAELLSTPADADEATNVRRFQVRIPGETKAGPATAIGLTVGSARSQGGVTIAVR